MIVIDEKYLMLFPNKENPTAIRFQFKKLKLQQYFTFKDFGGFEQAKEAAVDIRNQVVEKYSVIDNLRTELPSNKLFSPDGFIKSIKLHRMTRRVRSTADLHQEKTATYNNLVLIIRENNAIVFRTERNVSDYDFDTAYHELLQTLLDHHGIKPDLEIKRQLKKTRMLYLRKNASLNGF